MEGRILSFTSEVNGIASQGAIGQQEAQPSDDSAAKIRRNINARMDSMIPHDGSLIGTHRTDSNGRIMINPLCLQAWKIA